MKLVVERRTLALAQPFSAAWGTVHERELLLVELTDDDGARGYGEAAPLPGYEGPGADAVGEALRRYATVVEAHRGGSQGAGPMLDACRQEADVPPALAAVEMALWDLAGRRRGVPVAAMLTDDPAPAVELNATLTAADRAGVAEQAAAAARAGFRCAKVKVGIGDDGGRVAAARAAGGAELALRLDANGAWDVDTAVASIEALAAAGLELVEEPVHGVAGLRAVRERVSVRVAMDETAAELGALASGAADAVCLKVSRCGGISGLLAAAALVRAGGAEPYVASTLDGPLGVAAALHAAAALASRGPVPPCGLATLGLFAGIGDPLPVRAGSMAVPASGGLGVDPL